MWQAALTYAIVAAAGAWVAWHVLLPRGLRARLRQVLRRPAANSGGCGACGCDDTRPAEPTR
jgi:hypothetical protein